MPRDYSQPDGERISVTMSRIPATGERRGVIAGNPGGPGGPALGMFSGPANYPGTVAVPPQVREHYDLVAVQPRGHQWATPPKCASLSGLLNGQLLSPGDFYRACESMEPGYVGTITTENTARDLEEARKALGEDQLNLYGVSYGTTLMSTFATMFPQSTNKVILDSSVDPTSLWFRLGSDRKQVRVDTLNNLFAWIAQRDGEYHLGTTPLAVYRSWHARLLEHGGTLAAPLTPPPATEADLPEGVSVGEAALGQINLLIRAGWQGMATLDQVRQIAMFPALLNRQESQEWLALVINTALYNQHSWPQVAAALRDNALPENPVEEINAKLMEGLSDEQRAQVVEDSLGVAQAMPVLDRAIVCNENRVAPDLSLVKEFEKTKYFGGDAIVFNENQIASGQHCAGWPLPKPILMPSGAALKTAPLLLGYDADSATTGPGNHAMQAAMGGQLHTLPGSSHGVLLNDPDAFAAEITAYLG